MSLYNNWAFGIIAQLVEHLRHMQGVTGSSPVSLTIQKDRSMTYPFVLFQERMCAVLHRRLTDEGCSTARRGGEKHRKKASLF